MNADILRRAGIDYDRGAARFLGKAALYEKVLGKFLRDSTIDRAREAFEAGDARALFAAAHEFKGMCGNIAMASLADAAGTLVELLRGGEPSAEETALAFSRLEREYRAAAEAIREAQEERI